MSSYRIVFGIAAFHFCLAAQPPDLIVTAPPLVVDQTGNATGSITLQNTTDMPTPISLTVSEFSHGKTKYLLPGASVITAESDAAKTAVAAGKGLLPKSEAAFKITVSKIWEAGQSAADLKNNDVKIGTLTAIRLPSTYNVTIVSDVQGTPDIRFEGTPFAPGTLWNRTKSLFGYGDSPTLRCLVTLKNSDSFTFPFTWSLQAGDQVLTQEKQEPIEIAANSSAVVDLAKVDPKPWFFTSGTLKEQIVKGALILTPAFAGDQITQPLPQVNLPANIHLRYWTETLQQAANLLCVILLLTLGGVLSIWVHAGMPNTSRALALKKRLITALTKIDGMGAYLDSRWRSLLDSHRRHALRDLTGSPWIFPGFGATLDDLTKRVDLIEQWVAIAYDVSLILHDASDARNTIPPTVMLSIEDKCQRALAPVETGFTTADEITAMKANVAAARALIIAVQGRTSIPDLEKELTAREGGLRPLVEKLQQFFPDFQGMLAQFEEAAGADIKPADYRMRDLLSLKVNVLNEYRLLEGAATPGPNAPPSEPLVRLQKYKERLLAYLRPETFESLRLVKIFIGEMKQDIYQEVLLDQLKAAGVGLTIASDPPQVEPEAPVSFSLRFNRTILNDAVACQEWVCAWDFGDGRRPEMGYKVYHCFKASAHHCKVQVSITDLEGNKITQEPIPKDVEIAAKASSESFYTPHAETMLEASRLALVLAVVVFGLIATAQQQIQAMTYFGAIGAVFALGFGADTLKNLLTPKPPNNP